MLTASRSLLSQKCEVVTPGGVLDPAHTCLWVATMLFPTQNPVTESQGSICIMGMVKIYKPKDLCFRATVTHVPEYHWLPLRHDWLIPECKSLATTSLCCVPCPVLFASVPLIVRTVLRLMPTHSEIHVSGSAIRAQTWDNLLKLMLHETHTFRKAKTEDSEVLYLWHTILCQ